MADNNPPLEPKTSRIMSNRGTINVATKPAEADKNAPSLLDSSIIFLQTMSLVFQQVVGHFFGAIMFLKTPLVYFLVCYLLVVAFFHLGTSAALSIQKTLQPVCHIPGIGFLNLPFCPDAPQAHGDTVSAKLTTMIDVQANFGNILDHTTEGIRLPYQMKESELALRRLYYLIKHSDLDLKESLEDVVFEFIKDTKIAGSGLTKFNVKVFGTVDAVLRTTRWTSKLLQDIARQEASASVLKIFFHQLLKPFIVSGRSKVRDQYLVHATTLRKAIRNLISRATDLLVVLNRLDDHLGHIQDISGNQTAITKHRAKVLNGLWYRFGGKASEHLNILEQVNTYQKMALEVVSLNLKKLEAMQSGIEEVELAVEIGAFGADGYISEDAMLEEHIMNIEQAIERLETRRDVTIKVRDQSINEFLKKKSNEDLM